MWKIRVVGFIVEMLQTGCDVILSVYFLEIFFGFKLFSEIDNRLWKKSKGFHLHCIHNFNQNVYISIIY